jgi:hypothetical protein
MPLSVRTKYNIRDKARNKGGKKQSKDKMEDRGMNKTNK